MRGVSEPFEVGERLHDRTALLADEPVAELVDHVFALPLRSQLGILRTIVPKILARLAPQARQGFIRDLNRELERAEMGGEVYDIRHHRPVSRGSVPSPDLEMRRERRRQARATSTYCAFLDRLREKVPGSRDQAEEIAAAVLCALEQRLVPGEAEDLESQLPSKLRELLVRCEKHERLRPRKLNREQLLAMIADHLTIGDDYAAFFAGAVFETVAEQVSPGEIQQVKNMLPADIRSLWPEAH